MMIVGNTAGGKNISFGDGLRLGGAGRIVCADATGFFTAEANRLLIGEGAAVSVAGDDFVLDRGQAVLIPANTFYTVATSAAGAVFADVAAAGRLARLPYKRVYGEGCARIEALVDALATRDGALILASEVFSLIAEHIALEDSPHTVDEIKDFIDTYFYLPLTIDGLSKAAGYSRGYLTAKFTNETGVSPYRYVTETRLKAAAKLLRESDASVSAVASVCGYASIERFSDMFRRFTGKSPAKYRAGYIAERSE